MLRRYYTGPELAKLRLDGNRIYGAPAASQNKHTKNLNNIKGFFGEEIIGNILNLLAVENEGAFVCHSVAFVDNTQGETDHVFIYKDRIILIETKAFSGYTSYRVSKEGFLKGSHGKGRGRRLDDSNVYKKVAAYQEMFPNRKVQAILAITRDNVKTWSENGKYKVASLDNIMQVLRSILDSAEDVKEPAWPAVKVFANTCVKPVHSEPDIRSVSVGVIPPNPQHQQKPISEKAAKFGLPKKQPFANRPMNLRYT